jgi:hypothetical protein
MKYDAEDSPTEELEAEADDAVEVDEDALASLEERLSSLRSSRGSNRGYSPQARQRIEYLQELRRLRAQIGDDAIDTF